MTMRIEAVSLRLKYSRYIMTANYNLFYIKFKILMDKFKLNFKFLLNSSYKFKVQIYFFSEKQNAGVI